VAFPKQAFIDAAAVEIVAGYAANPSVQKTQAEIAVWAYDLAEALWRERERRNTDHEATQTETPT
jgi:hypothetical protein